MAEAAQLDRHGALAGTGLCPVPVPSGATGPGEHGVGLATQVVNVAGVIGAPAGLVVIGGGRGPRFSFLAEGKPFIPAALEMEEVRSASHTVWRRWLSPARKRGKRGRCWARRFENGKRSCLLEAVLHDERVGALFEPVAGFLHDFGPALAQELGDIGTRAYVLSFWSGTTSERLARVRRVASTSASDRSPGGSGSSGIFSGSPIAPSKAGNFLGARSSAFDIGFVRAKIASPPPEG